MEEIFELKDNTVINFCKIVGGAPASRINLTEPQAYNELDAFIKKNETPSKINSTTYTIYTIKKQLNLTLRLSYGDLLTSRVIYKKGNEFIWDAPKDDEGVQLERVTWDRETDVLAYLEDPRYQSEQEILDRQLVARART